MKFKHTINVLIDNFKVTYKLLVYQLIVLAISIGLGAAIIIPFINSLEDVTSYINLTTAFKDMFAEALNGELGNLATHFTGIRESFAELLRYLGENPDSLVLSSVALVVLLLVRGFLISLGNYTAGAMINDKMSMQADSHFVMTMIKNLGKASLYSVIYAPICFVFDAICVGVLYLLFFVALIEIIPLMITLMLFVVCMVLLVGLRLMLTTDWMPALICGKKKMGEAMGYAILRESGKSGSVFSFYASSAVAILAINVLAAIGSFGAAPIITIPLSYLYLLCYQFVTYCDNNEIKYFTDKRTIIKPEHEKETSREQFLRGDHTLRFTPQNMCGQKKKQKMFPGGARRAALILRAGVILWQTVQKIFISGGTIFNLPLYKGKIFLYNYIEISACRRAAFFLTAHLSARRNFMYRCAPRAFLRRNYELYRTLQQLACRQPPVPRRQGGT